MRLTLAIVIVLAACSKEKETAAPAVAVKPPPADAAPAPPPAPAPDAAPAPPLDAAPKAIKPTKTWPYRAWDRAEAITYNHVDYGPGIQLRVHDDTGWSTQIVDRKPISTELAQTAVAYTTATGEMEVSNCAFPRHAVVLFAGDTPVGSVNVCFSCGDILLWPDVLPERGDREYTKKEMAAYDKTYPKWEAFFRDDVGVSIESQWR